MWVLPVAVVVCVQTARHTAWQGHGPWPVVVVTGWLWWTLTRLVRAAEAPQALARSVRRGRLLALMLWGLSPFLHWHARVPDHPWFSFMTLAAGLTGWLLLIECNRIIPRVLEACPDLGVMHEVNAFCRLNRALFVSGGILWAGLQILSRAMPTWEGMERWPPAWRHVEAPLWTLFLVTPLALTLVGLWKTRQTLWAELCRRAGD